MYNEAKSNSKKNSMSMVVLNIYEFILLLFYNFLDSNYIAVLVFVFTAGSLLSFYMIHMQAPYNHPYVMKY